MRVSIPLPNARGHGRTRLTGEVALHGNFIARTWQAMCFLVALIAHEVMEWLPRIDAHANRWAARYALGVGGNFGDAIARGESPDPLVPEPIVAQIISELPRASALISRARTLPLPSSINRIPVLDVLPVAYFVTGDTGLKQTTKAMWKNIFLNVEEIAVLLPVPDAYIDDSSFPIWDSVRPLLVEAIGGKLDAAGLFGDDKPASWPTDIVTAAIAAGNTVTEGDGEDLGVDVASMGELLGTQGFGITGFASRPGFSWRLVGIRSQDGIPIYQGNLQAGAGAGLYGFPLGELMNGAWDASAASLIAGDWSKAIVGIRRDINFTPHTDGVISDAEGAVMFNAMQQDATIYRAVFRVAFATANPVTRLEATEGDRYPFAVLEPVGS